jgi:diacylglycerol kinase (ATP)
MKPDTHADSSDQRTLAEARASHAKRLKKVEQARSKLERASRKLHALEAEIARLDSAQHGGKPRRAQVIFNPRSKGVADGTYSLERIVDCLCAHGITPEVGIKTSGKVARALAKAAVERGDELVIVVAGDGTIEDVVGELAGSTTALGIIPTGTMNNIARSLGAPLDLEGACALLGAGITRHIDLGRVITSDKPQGAYFLESAGVGLSALAAPIGQDEEKGRWALLVKAIGKFLTFAGADVQVSCDDGEILQAHTQVVTVSNAPLFGKNMLIGPDAKMDDHLLDVALYDGMSKLDLERYFMAIADGKRVDDPRVAFRRVRRVRVSADAPLKANADLEILADQQSWEIEIVPGALAVVAGKGIALTLPVEAVASVPPLAGPQVRRDPDTAPRALAEEVTPTIDTSTAPHT